MRSAALVLFTLIFASACVNAPRMEVTEPDLAGTYRANLEFGAEERLHLKGDGSFTMFTVTMNYRVRTTPPSGVAEPSGHKSGHWAFREKEVVLKFETGVSTSLNIQVDREYLSLVDGGIRYRKLHAERPNKAPEPTPGAVTPRATEGEAK